MASKYDVLRVNVAKLAPGEAFIATKGEEFTCELTSFQGVVHRLAADKGHGWRATTVSLPPSSVVYAFYRQTDYMKPNLSAYPIVKKLRREV